MRLKGWLGALAAIWVFQWLCADRVDPYFMGVMIYAGINIILAVSLNLVNGFTGQFSMGHAGFMSVGGYTAAFVTSQLQGTHPDWLTSPVIAPALFVAALLTGGLAAALVGYGVGLPSLRLKGRLPGDRHPRLRRDHPGPDHQHRCAGRRERHDHGIPPLSTSAGSTRGAR